MAPALFQGLYDEAVKLFKILDGLFQTGMVSSAVPSASYVMEQVRFSLRR